MILLHSVSGRLAVAIGLAVLLPALRRHGERGICGLVRRSTVVNGPLAGADLVRPRSRDAQPALADAAASQIPDLPIGTAVAPRSMPVMARWMPESEAAERP